MIDLHCHILHGVDDGPNDLFNALTMANTAVDFGITHLFATPHHLNERYHNSKVDILNRVIEFNKYLERENIPLTVHPGQELRIHHEIFESIEKDEILTLNNMGKYLLVELPSYNIPTYTHEVVYELLLKGITPIIVHPERNIEFLENHNLLFELVQEGVLTQLTSGSIIGHFGKKIKLFSEKIIEHRLAHFIATDAHNVSSRGFSLQDAYAFLTNKYGIERTNYFKQNAEWLLQGKSLCIEQPYFIRKKILGIF